MTRTADEFYSLRDQRTSEYIPDGLNYGARIHVVTDVAAAETRPGQVLLLSLASQLARVFRCITFDVPQRIPNLAPEVAAGETLDGAVLGLVHSVDPFGMFTIGRAQDAPRVRIGIGEPAVACDWYVGADRALGFLAHHAVPMNGHVPGSVRGAGVSSCLGAAAVIRHVLGLRTLPRRLSAWNYLDGEKADPGPDDVPVLDVGHTWVIGAGAVGSCLVYWLRILGVAGEWIIVDPDRVALHNTNRSLLFLPQHAGWPEGAPQLKANVLAGALPSARPVAKWYDECTEEDLPREPDLILALANDRAVRSRIASRSHVVVLHATTSRHWGSQLHRHIATQDDCIACRLPEKHQPAFECAKGQLVQDETRGPSLDAALPFLSAASGLMLATALQRLQTGVLTEGEHNDWYWSFEDQRDTTMVRTGTRNCSEACGRTRDPDLVVRLNAHSRWVGLVRERRA